jgi:hypothetical protein
MLTHSIIPAGLAVMSLGVASAWAEDSGRREQRLSRPHHLPVVHNDDRPKILRRQIVENAAAEIAAIEMQPEAGSAIAAEFSAVRVLRVGTPRASALPNSRSSIPLTGDAKALHQLLPSPSARHSHPHLPVKPAWRGNPSPGLGVHPHRRALQ